MALNLSNIKSEATKNKEEEILAADNQKKIKEGVTKHREDLKKWFISLFPNEKVENKHIDTSIVFEGGIEITLALHLTGQSPSGQMIKLDHKADFQFNKTKNGKVIASILFLDMTDYLNLDSENLDYKYAYEDQGKKKTIKFSELENILQEVVDK